jgi:phospholipase D1/2
MTRSQWLVCCVMLVGLTALAAAWSHSPLAVLTRLDTVAAWAQEAGGRPWVPVAVLAAYTPASVTLFPRPLITLFAVLAFGPWLGFACAFLGIMLAAIATYALGAGVDVQDYPALSGPRVRRVQALLRRGGVLAVTAVRLVPLAPFAVVNAVAGALRIRLAHFAAGTALGILPGTAIATVLGEQITAAIRSPASVNPYLVGAVLLGLCGATLTVRRWLFGQWKAR